MGLCHNQWCSVNTICNKFAFMAGNVGSSVSIFWWWTSDSTLGLYSLSRQISRSLEAARLDVIMTVSLWKFTGISAAMLPKCLSNFKAIEKISNRIPRFRNFTISCGKTSVRLVNRGPGPYSITADSSIFGTRYRANTDRWLVLR